MTTPATSAHTGVFPGPVRWAAALAIAGFPAWKLTDGMPSTLTDVNGRVYRNSELLTALAVLAAESSGNAVAINQGDPDGSFDCGGMQINNKAHRAKHSSWFTGDPHAPLWSDHIDNAAMAYLVYTDAGQSFRPWVSYNSGAHLGWHVQSKRLTRLAWAQQGIETMISQLAAGEPLFKIARIFLEAW